MKSSELTDSQPKLNVLVADDDTPTRMLLRAAISQWGYEVVEAKDGSEAWEVIKQSDGPRLLILDWIMPELDGIALCERSRKELKFQPYIILLTQVTGTTNLIKGLEAGADEFLSKPFNMAELRSRLSIGARIINNEKTLSEQHKKLQSQIEKIDTLTNKAMTVTRELSEKPDKEKLKQIQQSIENINKILREMELDTKENL